MTYAEALSYIASLAPRGWRLGLDRMHAFCNASGMAPMLSGPAAPNYIHVAGTNGKGSTTAYLQSLLVAAGLNTGAYFSPYVVDPRERVQLGREMISPTDLAAITEELRSLAEAFGESEYGGITEFEFKTALAFRYWQLKECDWVALEVGLGGRLDATNVITPRAGIIVSIGRDHMHILGNTVEEIAFEKAGIIKPGIPVVLGQIEDSPRNVILDIAQKQGAPVWQYGVDVAWEDGSIRTPSRTIEGVVTGISGAMQGHNCALAVAALEAAGLHLTDEQIRDGARLAKIPGRFELRTISGREVRFDGAHNEDSARNLRNSLDQYYPGKKLVLVTNMLHGHEIEEFYRPLQPHIRKAFVVPISFHRARAVDDTVTAIRAMGITATPVSDLSVGFQYALDDVDLDELLLVTGSFFLVGELLAQLG